MRRAWFHRSLCRRCCPLKAAPPSTVCRLPEWNKLQVVPFRLPEFLAVVMELLYVCSSLLVVDAAGAYTTINLNDHRLNDERDDRRRHTCTATSA